MGERAEGPEPAPAGRSAEQDMHEVPAPPGGTSYDPRPQGDQVRRSIAYLLIALLAFLVIALLAMVAFGVISVDGVKEFRVLVGAVVTLVSGATGYYFARKSD